jgi:hypothetical protein
MWIVNIIESERGWGQKVDEVKKFDTFEEAKAFQEKFNEVNQEDFEKTGIVPDWYMMAETPFHTGK